LQYTGGQLVFGGESGGVKIDYILVLALVEGTVDIDEFCRNTRKLDWLLETALIHLPPSVENGSMMVSRLNGLLSVNSRVDMFPFEWPSRPWRILGYV
jgi:hypothetical protein